MNLDDFKGQKITRREAIRLRCIDCCGGYSRGEESPKFCTAYSCPAWGYRNGGKWEPLPPEALAELGWEPPQSTEKKGQNTLRRVGEVSQDVDRRAISENANIGLVE